MSNANDYIHTLQQAELLQLRGLLQTIAKQYANTLHRVPTLESELAEQLKLGLRTELLQLSRQWDAALPIVNDFLVDLDKVSINHPEQIDLPTFGHSLLNSMNLKNASKLVADFDNKKNEFYVLKAQAEEVQRLRHLAEEAEKTKLAFEKRRNEEVARLACEELIRNEEIKRAEETRRLEETKRAEEARLLWKTKLAEEASRLEENKLIEAAKHAELAQQAEITKQKRLEQQARDKIEKHNSEIRDESSSVAWFSVPVTAIFLWVTSWKTHGLGDFLLTFFFGTPIWCFIIFYIVKYIFIFSKSK